MLVLLIGCHSMVFRSLRDVFSTGIRVEKRYEGVNGLDEVGGVFQATPVDGARTVADAIGSYCGRG